MVLWRKCRAEGWKQQGSAGDWPDEIMLAIVIQGKVQKARVKDHGMVQGFSSRFDFMQFPGIDEAELARG